MEEFISIYESEPCLWQTKCKEYHDKNHVGKRASFQQPLLTPHASLSCTSLRPFTGNYRVSPKIRPGLKLIFAPKNGLIFRGCLIFSCTKSTFSHVQQSKFIHV